MPEVTNKERAAWAKEAVDDFAQRTKQAGEDLNIQIGDLLCDLMHLCDEEGVNFQACLRQGLDHYTAEMKGEV